MKMKFFAATAIALMSVTATAHADITWETDYAKAQAKSKETGKPIFIDFYTDWCHWCKVLEEKTYPDAKVQALAEKFVMVKLDAEKGGKETAEKFKVDGYPTLAYISAKGTTLAVNPGYVDVPNFTKTLQEMLDKSAAEKKAD